MNTDHTAHNHNTGWQILGELELPISASVEDALYSWLGEILHPLNFQEELQNNIITSAHDGAMHAIHTKTMPKIKYIHITVFIPSRHAAKEVAWGFFRLEKIEDTKNEQAGGDHAIELYLYGEED